MRELRLTLQCFGSMQRAVDCDAPIPVARQDSLGFPTFWGEDLIVHSTLDGSRKFSFVIAGILAVNGYLAVRNFAYSFFGRIRAQWYIGP